MSSETVAKSVGKKLRYYFEVKRLEDGFDLSGVNAPQLNHPPLKSGIIWDLVKRQSPYKENIVEYATKREKHPTMPQWMYRHHPREGKAIRPEFVGFGVGLKSEKRKQIKGGFPLMRSVPSSK
ncbi:uncharacterized protein LOC123562422 isoform X1 [Mercenaria mercenaria]|uniref:uncharacterized protein LOC123562422 isoform X1 n=1 Tax=Mercenaria mercenaria TaxID=6596 RepID=UPI00234F21FC|nr:uncharacterized protein LOC123562422 isoform X1 [Mercenaria mercenaria]